MIEFNMYWFRCARRTLLESHGCLWISYPPRHAWLPGHTEINRLSRQKPVPSVVNSFW